MNPSQRRFNPLSVLSGGALALAGLIAFIGPSVASADLPPVSTTSASFLGCGPSSWTVPTGVSKVRVTLVGGGGGTGGYDGPTGSRRLGGDGGPAGKLVTTLSVTAGDSLSFNLGCRGSSGVDRPASAAGGEGGAGYASGGAGGAAGGHGQSGGGGGGGGATSITVGSDVFVAGGAGGGAGSGADRAVVTTFTSTNSNPSTDSNGAAGVSRAAGADGGGGGGGGGGFTTGGAGGPTNGANAPTPPSTYYPDYGATVGQAGNSGTSSTSAIVSTSTTTNNVGGSVEFAWANTPTISNGPDALTKNTSASFDLSGDPGAALECALDGDSWAPCSSPFQASNLADGKHTLKVREVTLEGVTSAAATYDWTVKTFVDLPELSGLPSQVTYSNSASFTITGEKGATFECSVDGAPFTTCSSPLDLNSLSDGNHTVSVRQIDTLGNVSLARDYAWTVRRACAPPVVGTAFIRPTLVKDKWAIHPDGRPGADDPRPACGLLTIQISISRTAPDQTILPPDTPSYAQGILAYAADTMRRGPAPRWIRIENRVGQWSDWKQLRIYGRN